MYMVSRSIAHGLTETIYNVLFAMYTFLTLEYLKENIVLEYNGYIFHFGPL